MKPNHFNLHTPESILASAEKLISLKGYRATGIAEVLSLSGVSRGSFYHFFDSKEALLHSVLERFFRRYHAEMDRMLSSTEKADLRLLKYFESWKSRSNPVLCYDTSLIVILASELSDLNDNIVSIFNEQINLVVSKAALTISQGKKEGTIISMLDSKMLSKEIFHMWLGASLMAKARGQASLLESTQKITHTLIYSQFY